LPKLPPGHLEGILGVFDQTAGSVERTDRAARCSVGQKHERTLIG
jgi:hypothetical protein